MFLVTFLEMEKKIFCFFKIGIDRRIAWEKSPFDRSGFEINAVFDDKVEIDDFHFLSDFATVYCIHEMTQLYETPSESHCWIMQNIISKQNDDFLKNSQFFIILN